jgi:hypothetical protein
LRLSDGNLKLLDACLSGSSEQTPPNLLTSFSDDQIKFVVQTWKEYENNRRKIRLQAFVKELKKRWRRQNWLTPPPSRQTVADMLSGNGIRVAEPTRKKFKYHEQVKKFFPNAQTCLDGKRIDIALNGQAYFFTVEMAKDLASDAITAAEFGASETAELVEKTYQQHCQAYGNALSVLVDNGSGNKKAAVNLGKEGTLVISAYVQRPETKGQLEGEFGRFERLTTPILIQGQDEETLALSFAKSTVEMYAMLRNQTPRCASCPFTPEELMRYQTGDLEIKSAYNFLIARQEQKKENQAKRLKISQERQELMDSVVKEQKLRGNLLIFKKSFSSIETATIKEAEIAFAVYAGHDHFDESKRTMVYFCGIAKNIQYKKDQQRKEETARLRYGLDQKARKHREEIKTTRKEFLRRREHEKKPWLSLIENLKSETNLAPEFKTFSIFRNKIDRTLSFMLTKGEQRFHTMIEKTEHAIMSLAEYPIQTRFCMVAFVKERMIKLSIPEAKTVTL